MQNDFQKTNMMLARMDEALDAAEKAFAEKKESLESEQKNINQQLERSLRQNEQLKSQAAEISHDVETVINHLDKVLNENGTSNNNY